MISAARALLGRCARGGRRDGHRPRRPGDILRLVREAEFERAAIGAALVRSQSKGSTHLAAPRLRAG